MKMGYIEVPIFLTPNGERTRSIWETHGKTCPFYITEKFATQEICIISKENRLLRSGERENGYLIPAKDCPIKEDKA